MKLIIDIPEDCYDALVKTDMIISGMRGGITLMSIIYNAVAHGTPLTQSVLADALMEERIRGKLDSDTTFEKDIIRDVKCRLTVSIIDHRPCYCGAELREVWREGEDKE